MRWRRVLWAGGLVVALVALGCGGAAPPARPLAPEPPPAGCAELYDGVVSAAARLTALGERMSADPVTYYAVADAMTTLGRHLDRPFAPARVEALAAEYREAAAAAAAAATHAAALLAEAERRAREADQPAGPALAYREATSRLVALCSEPAAPAECREVADLLLGLSGGSPTAARTERVRTRLGAVGVTSPALAERLVEVDGSLSRLVETLAYAESLSARAAEAEIELGRANARFLGLDTRAYALCRGQPR